MKHMQRISLNFKVCRCADNHGLAISFFFQETSGFSSTEHKKNEKTPEIEMS